MDLHFNEDLLTNIDARNFFTTTSEPQIINENNNMGIARYEQRHSPSLENLFSNREVLARRLKNRPDKDDLIDRNIIPANIASPTIHDKVTQLERKKTGDIIQRKIRARPSRQTLIQRHILSDTRVDPSLVDSLSKLERKKIADHLNERLLCRPGPIELIQEHILPVESPIHNALEQENLILSPVSSTAESPSVLELENSITTLNCHQSPSPPLPTQHDPFSLAFKNQITKIKDENFKPSNNDNQSNQIFLSQKENKKLVQSLAKKQKQSKPKVKKLKFHNCLPPDMPNGPLQPLDDSVDDRYKSLLEQQTLYLRLQVMQQNAMLNAMHGNNDSMGTANDDIENVIEKERNKSEPLKNIEGRKFDELRVIDLRAQLKQRGLIVSGSKAKLIERLMAFQEGKCTAVDFSHGGNSVFSENMKNMQNLKIRTNSNSSDQSPGMQVTTYSTDTGETFQLVQAVPGGEYQVVQAVQSDSPHSIMQYQVVPNQQLSHHVNLQNVVVQQQQQQQRQHHHSRTNSTPISPSMLSQISPTSPQIQFQLSPPQHQSPYLFQQQQQQQAGNQQPQVAIVRQDSHHNNDNALTFITPSQDHGLTHLSQSVPVANNFLQDNSSVNTHLVRTVDSIKDTHLNNMQTNELLNRNRTQSEPFLRQNYPMMEMTSQGNNSPYFTMTTAGNNSPNNAAGQLKIQSNALTNITANYQQKRQLSNNEVNNPSGMTSPVMTSPKDYNEIMEIIGELSTPSPSAVGSPSSLTHSTSQQNILSPTHYSKIETSKMNPIFDSRPNKSQLNKFLNSMNAPPQQIKQFNSVPENMNVLGHSPVNNNLVTSPYGSLGTSNYGGSMSNLNDQYGGSNNSLNLSSSLGNIPQQLSNSPRGLQHVNGGGSPLRNSNSNIYHDSTNSYLTTEYRNSPTNLTNGYRNSPTNLSNDYRQSPNFLSTDTSNLYNPTSPMSIGEETMQMEFDSLTSGNNIQNNSLSWLDLNMESSTSPPQNTHYNIHQAKDMHTSNSFPNINNTFRTPNFNVSPLCVETGSRDFENNNLRSQTSIYGSPKPNDGFVSLFDLEGGEF